MPEVKPEAKEDELRAIDRDLSRLLAVEPSPEFAAEVRVRIEQQPARAFAWWPWAITSVAAVAVIVTAVVLSARKAPGVVAPVSVRADIYLPPREPAPQTQALVHAIPVVQSVRRSGPAIRGVEPEVLIDPLVARAVRRLALEQPVLPDVPPEPSLEPVVVEPLKVSDIADLDGVRLEAGR